MKYCLAEHIMSYKVDDSNEMYLLNLDNNDTFLLNDVTAYIIESIEKKTNIKTIVEELYDLVRGQVTFEELKYDVNEFFHKLEEQGFIIKE